MRLSCSVITALVATGLSGTAMAQTAASTTTAAQAPAPVVAGTTRSHWIVSGFVGSDFGKATTGPSVNFGGDLSYLWKGVVGAEALVEAAPSFKLENIALAENPHTSSYMGNIIAALPLGAAGEWQPYASGGWGSIDLRTTLFALTVTPHPVQPIAATTTVSSDQQRFGMNIGGGLMGFTGRIGFRGDVRYYKASTNNTPSTTGTAGNLFTQGLLSGLEFWRANIGVAVRW